MEPKKFLIGGMWEKPEWEIRFDEEVSNLERVCSHCYGERTDTHPTAYGGTYTTHVFKCKRVVVATNEGGFNTTGVCLDCILDAAKTLDEARKL